MNALTPSSRPSASFNSSPEASALALELAKILKLVAPVSMSEADHLSWLASAVDALDGIRASEVAAVSVEIRRKVTRPSQIVPAIADLVADQRARSARMRENSDPRAAAERRINEEASERRHKAKSQAEVESAWLWERDERKAAGLAVPPIEPALSPAEIERIPAHGVSFGLRTGFLKRVGERTVEVTDTGEIDAFRERQRAALNREAGK